jgi:hypothetical protein
MDIVDVFGLAAVVGTVMSAVLLADAAQDMRAARGDATLMRLTRFRLMSESLRFIAQLAFLVVAVIARFREPGTFAQTIRYLLVGVPIILAVGSVVSWYSKRRLLTDADTHPH